MVLNIVCCQRSFMGAIRVLLLFLFTAIAEIVGCYLAYLFLREQKTIMLLVPAVISLGVFAWLLTLHPEYAGRTYAAYGGVYVATAVAWLWLVEKRTPDVWDLLGSFLVIAGALIIAFAPHSRSNLSL